MLRSRLRAAVLVAVVGTLSIAATAATGSQTSQPASISDAAFQPVSVPEPPGASDASGPIAPRAVSSPAPAASLDLPEIREPAFATTPPARAQPSIRAAQPLVVVKPTPTPTPKPRADSGTSQGTQGSTSGSESTSTGRSLSGRASYYCRAGSSPCTYGYPDTSGFDAYAAAGPRLRAALGSGWRGSVVSVDGIRVKLIDWCQCYQGEPHEKLLDLYYDVFARAGSSVTVRW